LIEDPRIERYADWLDDAYVLELTDGLPLAPPDDSRVREMLASTSRDGGEVLGAVAPSLRTATVFDVAVQAVMAGADPRVFPVVIAAVEAVLDRRAIGRGFNLEGVQSTACGCAPLVIVSGDAAAFGLDCVAGTLGATRGTGAAIGRALRLVLRNIGKATPGRTDMTVMGHQGKLTYAVAEHPASPWEPLHVARGLYAAKDAVTVFACDAPHALHLADDPDPEELCRRVARTIAQPGSLNMYWGGEAAVVVTLQTARRLADAGWGRDDVCGYVYELARRSPADLDAFHPSRDP